MDITREERRETRESGKRHSDAIAGDLETGRDAALRMAATGEHADAALLRHGEQVNDSDDSEESEGEESRPFQDGRK